MCGIVGFIATDLSAIDVPSGLEALTHRGPDSAGTFSAEAGAYRLWIGHRRLSIIDLSARGSQPMSECGVTLIYNGEVYNYRELRTAHLPAESFKSESDTEVILKLYLRYGADFLHMLNGDFALAIYDSRIAKLFLVRDRLGIKPLYLYRRAGQFAFASEIKAFKAAGLPLSLNEAGIGNYLVFKYSPGQETLLQEVSRLQPGSMLEFDLADGSEKTTRYWSLAENKQAFPGTYQEAKSELRRLVESAVNLRLIADVPIANYLSGGLDSSIIAHYLRGGQHVHYCAVKSSADLKAEGTTSDGFYAKKLADEWGLDLREIRIGNDELSEANIDRAVWACDDLIADGSIIPAMLIAEQAAAEHRVVLSGMGADELFLGYNGHFLLKLSAYAARVPALKNSLGRSLRQIDAGSGSFLAYRRYLRKWGENWGKDFEAGRYSVVGDVDSALSIFKGKPAYAEVFTPYFKTDENTFETLLHFETENFLVKNLHYLDRSSMAFGLESRVPYLDHRLVEFAAGLPTHFKLDWKLKSKRILKETYADALPGYITHRRKAGFGMPLRTLLKNPNTIAHLLPLEFLESIPSIDMDAARRIIEVHRSGSADHSALIYALIALRSWMKAYR